MMLYLGDEYLEVIGIILAQSYSCIESSLAFATGPTSGHRRVKSPGLYRKLMEFLHL